MDFLLSGFLSRPEKTTTNFSSNRRGRVVLVDMFETGRALKKSLQEKCSEACPCFDASMSSLHFIASISVSK